MDDDRITGKWTELKGRLRKTYGELTDDELKETKGERQKLEGLLQQRLGKTKDEIRQTVDRMLESI